MNKLLIVAVSAALLFAGGSWAQAMERFAIITTAELESLLHQRELGKTDFVLVNTLDRIIFEDEAIPGSVNLPWSEITERHRELQAAREKLIITHCMGYR